MSVLAFWLARLEMFKIALQVKPCEPWSVWKVRKSSVIYARECTLEQASKSSAVADSSLVDDGLRLTMKRPFSFVLVRIV